MYTIITRSQSAKYNINKSIRLIEWLVNLLKNYTEDEVTPHGNKYRKMFSIFDERRPNCIYNDKCGNVADYKTLNGKEDGTKSESWGELDYDNNHLYYWNLCGKCHKTECEEDTDVCCVLCQEFVCKFNEDPKHKDTRDEAICDECFCDYYAE